MKAQALKGAYEVESSCSSRVIFGESGICDSAVHRVIALAPLGIWYLGYTVVSTPRVNDTCGDGVLLSVVRGICTCGESWTLSYIESLVGESHLTRS